MKEISWGNLPRYFFKEYETGISINTVALGCKAEDTYMDFPQLDLLQSIKAPEQCSKNFAQGFNAMLKQINEKGRDNNPFIFLYQALSTAVFCCGIKAFEILCIQEELHEKAEEICLLFNELPSNISFSRCEHHAKTEVKKLIIILDAKTAQTPRKQPSLYCLKQKLQKNNLPHITITLADINDFYIGALYALMSTTAAMLKKHNE
ncbi:MAG: hypothetical protein IJP33_05490 [Firmicutes bacterium]|nr:hypothetical protein [Bacillota bacterium]